MKSSACKLMFLLLFNVLPVSGEVKVESSIDWFTGRFTLTASRPLDPGMSPLDHPKALDALETELPSYVVDVLKPLPWNRDGTLGDQMMTDSRLRESVERLADSMHRDWSRISIDRKNVEALYSVDLFEAFAGMASSSVLPVRLDQPIGWVPTPDDEWTGIVIYVPDGLRVRGTGLTSPARHAALTRLLDSNLQTLYDPVSGFSGTLSYLAADRYSNAESIIGRRPYQVMARELYGEYPCDILISSEESRRILASESGRRCLVEGRIVILFDHDPQ